MMIHVAYTMMMEPRTMKRFGWCGCPEHSARAVHTDPITTDGM
jgi:hypothetical protein